ncbi:hypothetical protein IKG16_00715 [Candidatus Saccharibacteria bacterium]|nr:hypothetical protein [Candidatus Saccharibacteria bacterium]
MKDKIQDLLDKILRRGSKSTDKRVRISKAQQQMMIIVAATSVVFGICIVLTIHFVQYMFFNAKVINEEDASIANYGKTIKSSGACLVKDANGNITNEELLACDPDKTPLSKTTGTLRYNVLVNMAQNENLESVAREHLSDCYENGKRIDYTKKYEQATSESDKELYLSMVKMCSALRVIPDALPAQRNDEALLASLNEIFILSDWQPESLTPGDSADSSSSDEDNTSIGQIPVTLSVEANAQTTMRVLQNIEKSIRTFQPTRATISWSTSGLSLQSLANAYYIENSALVETTTTVRAAAPKKGGN